jgi:CBS domain-containing protein
MANGGDTMLNYKAIEIFTSESARYRNKSVAEAVIHYIRGLKIAARCIVTRGIAGCNESGELATTRLEVLSFNLPIRIYIIVPVMETDRVLDELDTMINDGIITVHDLNVLSHRTRNTFFPRHLTVYDVMTSKPKYVMASTNLNEAARLLLSSIFTGLPVLDEHHRPIGVVSQGDLIRKGELPLRLGLLAKSDQSRLEDVLNRLAKRQVAEVMTTPAVIISEDKPLTEAVIVMLDKGVKRLPVVNGIGCLTGMLSRSDIFRTVMRETPAWNTFRTQKIEVNHLKNVRDIVRRETQTVSPETTLDEVIQVIDRDDIQRVAVVDGEGKLLGLISDRDLLSYFKPEHEDIWNLLAKVKHYFKQNAGGEEVRRRLAETRADTVMNTKLIKVHEEMLIEEAIALMIDNGLKRLPVVDADDRFKGLISRDSLLRTGFSGLFAEENSHASV